MIKGFMTGSFDIIHRGHIEIIKYGRSMCDYFIIAIDEDDRIKSKKGNSRPFNNLEDRMEVLSSIRYVDKVVSFKDEVDLENILNLERPEWWLMGSDWKDKPRPEINSFCKNIFFNRIGDYSTTKILKEE